MGVPGGEGFVSSRCRRRLADRDSIDILDLPAVSAGGRLAYLTSTSRGPGSFPSTLGSHQERSTIPPGAGGRLRSGRDAARHRIGHECSSGHRCLDSHHAAGDTRIYRRGLDPGEETVAHDATAGVPASPGASGRRIVARIAGGLYVVHLARGATTEVAGADITRPALHPDGTLVVGEILHPENFDFDLWRLTIP